MEMCSNELLCTDQSVARRIPAPAKAVRPGKRLAAGMSRLRPTL